MSAECNLTLSNGKNYEVARRADITRSRRCSMHGVVAALLVIAACAVRVELPHAAAADKDWDGSTSQNFNTNANWNIGGAATTVPTGVDNAFIQLEAANVTLSAFSQVENLTLSNGALLSTSGERLLVDDTTTLDENTAGGVQLTVNSGAVTNDFDTNFLSIIDGAALNMAGGLAQIDRELTVTTGSFIFGNGIIEMTGTTAGDSLNNNGAISTSGGTLTLRQFAVATTAAFDLDGTMGAGIVTVSSTTSDLVIDGPVTDDYNGVMTVGDGNSITFNEGWTLSNAAGIALPKGTLNLSGGASGNATVAGTASTISGIVNATAGRADVTTTVSFTSSAEVNVAAGAILSLQGATQYAGGAYTGAGEIYQTGDANVTASTTIDTATFDLDGQAGGTTQTTIANGVTFTLNVDSVEHDANDTFSGTLVLNGGNIDINMATPWIMAGTLHLNQVGGNFADVFAGANLDVSGDVNVTGLGRIFATTDFGATAAVTVNAGGRLEMRGATTYAGGSYTGAGELEQDAAATVTAITTIAVATLDLDGSANTTTTTVNSGVALRVSATNLGSAGFDDFHGTLNLNGGDLSMNVADAGWEMAGTLNMTQNGANIPQVSGSSINNLSGTVNVTGIAELNTFVDFEATATVNVPLAAANLRLSSSTFSGGGTYTGLGTITLNGNLTVAGITTLNVGTFDWDGDSANSETTVLAGAVFTINSTIIDDDFPSAHNGLIVVADTARVNVNTAAAWPIGGGGILRLGGPTAEVGGSANIDVTSATGRIEGTGRILVDVNTAGVTSPGLSAGILRIVGDFTQEATGLFKVELGGTAVAQYDRLDVFDTATLAGTLDVDLIGGFVPEQCDMFTVLTFSSHVGDFTTYTDLDLGGGLSLKPTFSATDLTLKVMPTVDGDANLDGTVNIFDVNLVSSNWGTAGPQGDVNCDGTVNIFDVNLISANWGAGGGGAAAVPEPATWAMASMIAIAIVPLIIRRRRAAPACRGAAD